MQISGPKNMKRMRGKRSWASRPKDAKPYVIRKSSSVYATGLWKESWCAIAGKICPFLREDHFCCEARRNLDTASPPVEFLSCVDSSQCARAPLKIRLILDPLPAAVGATGPRLKPKIAQQFR